MVGEEILIEIDTTLDRLIRNAEAIQDINVQDLSETELEGFQKTQESLLQHLMHMDQFLETKRKNLNLQDKRSASFKIQEKLLKFERLKKSYHQNVANTIAHKTAMMSKRRAKRVLACRED